MADNETGENTPGSKRVRILGADDGADDGADEALEPLDVGDLGADIDVSDEAVSADDEPTDVGAEAGEAPDFSDPLSLPLPAMAPGTTAPRAGDADDGPADEVAAGADDDFETAELQLREDEAARDQGSEDDSDVVAADDEETGEVAGDDDADETEFEPAAEVEFAGIDDLDVDDEASEVSWDTPVKSFTSEDVLPEPGGDDDDVDVASAVAITEIESEAVERRRRARSDEVDATTGDDTDDADVESRDDTGGEDDEGYTGETFVADTSGVDLAADEFDGPSGEFMAADDIGSEADTDDSVPVIKVAPDHGPRVDPADELVDELVDDLDADDLDEVAEATATAAAVSTSVDAEAVPADEGFFGEVDDSDLGEPEEYAPAHSFARRSDHQREAPAVAVKVGTGIGFGLVALLIIIFAGERGLAGLGILLITWVCVEYYGALYKAAVTVEEDIESEFADVGGAIEGDSEASDISAADAEAAVISLGHPTTPPASIVGIAATLGMSIVAYLNGPEALGVIAAFGIVGCVLWFLGVQHKGEPPLEAILSVSGLVQVGVLGSFAFLILRGEHGQALLLTVVILTITLDVASYAWGLSFGRRPLAPSVSPNKSVEGFLGGAGTTFVAAIVIVLMQPLYDVAFLGNWGDMLILAAVVSIFGVFGDLSESIVKRSLGIKDMGSFLPGHGGMFDRLDALLFVLPAAYVTIRLLGVGT